MRILNTTLTTLAMLSCVSLSMLSANNNVDQHGLPHWVRCLEEHYHRDFFETPPYSSSEKAFAKLMQPIVKKQLKKSAFGPHATKGVWRDIPDIRLRCLLDILEKVQADQAMELEEYEYHLVYANGDTQPQVVGGDPGDGVPIRMKMLKRPR